MDHHYGKKRLPGQCPLSRAIRRWPVALLVTALALPAAVRAQTTFANFLNPLSASSPGAHLYGVSVFSSYYTGGTPYGLPGSITLPVGPNPTYDVVVGATASFGWNKSGEGGKWNVSVNYTPSYVRSVRQSDYNLFTHAGSVSAGRRFTLTRKWSLGVYTSATVSEFPQFFFTPGTLDLAASIPVNFDDFAAAVLSGTYTNSQLASILTSTSAPASPVSPAQTFLYGSRILNNSAGGALSYSVSNRSSLQISFNATRSQSLQNSSTPGDSSRYFIPQSLGASAGLIWSYSLTPRTQVNATATASRTFSRLQDGYATSAQFGISRVMSRHWFAKGGIGAGMLLFNRDAFTAPSTAQYLANGSIGYKTYAHSVFVSYSRSLGDPYGAGSGTISNVSATWDWRRPGSAWVFFSTGGWQRLGNSSLNNATSWLAAAGLARALGTHMRMSAQYSYFRFPFATVTSSGLTQDGLSVALSWSPYGR